MITLTLAGARSLHLAAQGLLQPPMKAAAKEDVLATIRRMEGLQIDTISVVARSPYLVLWSRLGAYETRWLDELLDEGALFEYWSRAACFIPIEDYGLYRGPMLERASALSSPGSDNSDQTDTAARVLERIRQDGPLRSADFHQIDKQKGAWWNRKPEKVALDLLFDTGALMIARRENMHRVYDLHERVMPGWDDTNVPDRAERLRALILKALRALGAARPPWISWYFHHALRRVVRPRELDGILKQLVYEGLAIPVEIEGWTGPLFAHRDNARLAEEAAAGTLNSGVTTFLSPFDPVVHDRNRGRELFDFDYTIEVYTPEPRRKYGYFTLPILHRGALVGRLDPKAHRKDGIFEVKALYLEPGVSVTNDLTAGLAKSLREFADWHGTPEVIIRRSEPEELAGLVQSAL